MVFRLRYLSTPYRDEIRGQLMIKIQLELKYSVAICPIISCYIHGNPYSVSACSGVSRGGKLAIRKQNASGDSTARRPSPLTPPNAIHSTLTTRGILQIYWDQNYPIFSCKATLHQQYGSFPLYQSVGVD